MAALTNIFDIPQKEPNEIRIQQAAVKIWRGGAVAVVMGTGYATPLLISAGTHQFIGVSLETSDNTNGTAGTIVYNAPLTGYSSFLRVAREGCFAFNQSGLTQANVGQQAFFTDDNTISATPGPIAAGTIVTIDEQNSVAWVDIGNAVMPIVPRVAMQAISASGAINPHNPGTYVITKAGVAAETLAAPTATTDDGVTIVVTSNTANAHTLTATGLLQTGTVSVNVATFAAFAGAGLTLMAYQGKWNVIGSVGITFS